MRAGESFRAVHLVGWFEDLTEMEQVFEVYKGAVALHVEADRWRLEN